MRFIMWLNHITPIIMWCPPYCLCDPCCSWDTFDKGSCCWFKADVTEGKDILGKGQKKNQRFIKIQIMQDETNFTGAEPLYLGKPVLPWWPWMRFCKSWYGFLMKSAAIRRCMWAWSVMHIHSSIWGKKKKHAVWSVLCSPNNRKHQFKFTVGQRHCISQVRQSFEILQALWTKLYYDYIV